MKITITQIKDNMPVKVWHGKMGEDGLMYHNGSIDLELSRQHYMFYHKPVEYCVRNTCIMDRFSKKVFTN